MTVEEIDTLVIGASEAGVAMSEHLSKHIAERWRSERWDSLLANAPA